ncbi:hypothetical protein FXN63_04580 [Pigmentiphaga aceris]|uniref:Uncharacterized protein n=1 Tax=Pigmentiphaga aceris TaxID=1940612 RepID=A0A5C0AWV6_9BURK|nr:hypothetical protein [Pigmentiphaga aceris]QEI05191.1 hypothetical protein FXN63_04580 [Pigmentiphaga aceris]
MRKKNLLRLTALALCSAGVMAGAHAQTSRASDDAATRYRMEREACLSGQSHQDRQTCLREAGAAQGEAKAGRLDDRSAASYRQNALERCRVLPMSDRDACVARLDGTGRVSGSVEGGGILREYVQREVGVPQQPAAAPMPVPPRPMPQQVQPPMPSQMQPQMQPQMPPPAPPPRSYDGRPGGAVPYGGMPAPSMQPAPMPPAPGTR